MSQTTDPTGDIVDGQLDLGQHHMDVEVPEGALIRALQSVAALTEKCRLRFEEDAIRVTAGNPSRVAMVDVEFTDVEYTTHFTPVTVGFRLDDAISGAGFATATETVELSFADGDEHMTAHAGNFMDYIDLIDPSEVRDEPDGPDCEFETTATVSAMELKAAVGAVSGASHRGIQLVATDDQLRARGAERNSEGWPYERSIDADVDGPEVRSLYSDEFLTDLTSVLQPRGDVTLAFDDDWPVRITTDDGVTFTLAPQLIDEPPHREAGEDTDGESE